jgi:hypothetical protein
MDEQTVYVFEDGKEIAEAIPVAFHDNAHVKRRSPFAVPDTSYQKEELDHV